MNKSNTDTKTKSRKLLVLDLDNTLIESVDVSKLDFNNLPQQLVKFLLPKFGMMTFVRPNLFVFLNRCIDMGYDIGVWSAGVKEYVNSISDMLFSHIDIVFKFCRDQCLILPINGKETITKPLDLIWDIHDEYSADNTVVIDDLKSMHIFYPDNLLVIKPFRYTNETDKELLHMLILLRTLSILDSIQIDKRSKYIIE